MRNSSGLYLRRLYADIAKRSNSSLEVAGESCVTVGPIVMTGGRYTLAYDNTASHAYDMLITSAEDVVFSLCLFVC